MMNDGPDYIPHLLGVITIVSFVHITCSALLNRYYTIISQIMTLRIQCLQVIHSLVTFCYKSLCL